MTSIHVHLHDPATDAPRAPPFPRRTTASSTSDADEGGRWVTINGAAVHIGEGGKIDKGPKELMAKTENGAHAHHHEQKAQAHGEAMQVKGKQHPDYNAHLQAHNAHREASQHFKSADYNAEAGNVKTARAAHEAGLKKAAEAEKHGAAAGKNEPADLGTFQKPKAHQGLHANAEEDVKGSEKHEAEHKRLMGLYNGSKANWERNAVNNLVSNNATAAVQSKAQGLHHKAVAASEHAKTTRDPEAHRAASAALGEAIAAHGRAGGVGYAKKQEELAKAKKLHDAEANTADRIGHKEAMARHANLAGTHGSIAGRQAHREAARAHREAHESVGSPGYASKKAQAEQAGKEADAHPLHDPSMGVGNGHGDGFGGPAPKPGKEAALNHANHWGLHTDAARMAADRGDKAGAAAHAAAAHLHEEARQAHVDAQYGGTAADRKDAASKSERAHAETARLKGGTAAAPAAKPQSRAAAKGSPRSAAGGSGLEKIAARVAKKAAEEAADQDSKHKK